MYEACVQWPTADGAPLPITRFGAMLLAAAAAAGDKARAPAACPLPSAGGPTRHPRQRCVHAHLLLLTTTPARTLPCRSDGGARVVGEWLRDDLLARAANHAAVLRLSLRCRWHARHRHLPQPVRPDRAHARRGALLFQGWNGAGHRARRGPRRRRLRLPDTDGHLDAARGRQRARPEPALAVHARPEHGRSCDDAADRWPCDPDALRAPDVAPVPERRGRHHLHVRCARRRTHCWALRALP